MVFQNGTIPILCTKETCLYCFPPAEQTPYLSVQPPWAK